MPALSRLEELGLLLLQDPELPDVVALVAGRSPRSSRARSWWSHPRARLVFAVLSALEEHPDVLFAKLIFGKVTLVHRSLWPSLLVLGRSGEAWQLDRLTAPARALLERVRREGALTSHGAAVRELERRLLVHAEQVHTESGRHEQRVESWDVWARRRRVRSASSPARARRRLEEAAAALGAPRKALPWPETS
jgi:hypothetical protein